MSTVIPGIEILTREHAALVRGARTAVLAHPAAVGRDLTPAVDLLRRAGAEVRRLFAPEHGSAGRQDMETVAEQTDPQFELPVVSLYGDDEASLTPPEAAFEGIDLLVADLQDVGARYYTFAATILRAAVVAARLGRRVIIADRPNPIDGITIEGNAVAPAFSSFVSEFDAPQRHGLTIGEIVRRTLRQRGVALDLTVIAPRGWQRRSYWDATGLPWVLPSPNMPTLDTAIVYPGSCLLEATNLSEGRGTTRPFELVGAPWIDGARWAAALDRLGLPGAAFRPLRFVPAFQKHARTECGGVQLHVLDRATFRPVMTGVALLTTARSLNPERFAWRSEPYEFVWDRPAIDLLAGCADWRHGVEAGADPREILAGSASIEAAFREDRQQDLHPQE